MKKTKTKLKKVTALFLGLLLFFQAGVTFFAADEDFDELFATGSEMTDEASWQTEAIDDEDWENPEALEESDEGIENILIEEETEANTEEDMIPGEEKTSSEQILGTEEEDVLIEDMEFTYDPVLMADGEQTLTAEVSDLGVYYSFVEWKITWTGKTEQIRYINIYMKIVDEEGNETISDNEYRWDLSNYDSEGSRVFLFNSLDYNNDSGFKDHDQVYWKLTLCDSSGNEYASSEGQFALEPVPVTIHANGHGLDYSGTVRFGNYLASGIFTDPEGNQIKGSDIPKAIDGYVLVGYTKTPKDIYEVTSEDKYDADTILGSSECYVLWVKGIDTIQVDIPAPVCGTEVTLADSRYFTEQTPGAVVNIPEGAPYNVSAYNSGYGTYPERNQWYEDGLENPVTFTGTIKGGKDYCFKTEFLATDNPEAFAGIDDLTVTGNFKSYTITRSYTNNDFSTYNDQVGGTTYSVADVTFTVTAVHVPGDPVKEKEVAATCQEDGSYDKVVYCTACGDEISRETVIVPAGSDHHPWDDGVIKKKPGCTQKGEKLFTCTLCDETKTEEIAATGHSWGEWTVTSASTETKAGTETRICKNDASHKETRTVPKITAGQILTEEQMEASVLARTDDSDPGNSTFGLLQAKVKKVTKNDITITWKKISGADHYTVYANMCGKQNRYKKVATINGTSACTYTHKNLKKGTYYKFLIVANGKGKVMAVSKTLHAATSGGKLGNNKSVKINGKKKRTLKKGKTTKIKAKAVVKNKKLKVKTHRKLAFESDNPKVATVDKKGKVKAVGKGTCTIYVYSQDGISAAVKIKVK